MLEEEFLEAVEKGDTQTVVRLLGQTTSSIDVPIKNGQNALHIAAQIGNADIVSVLLLSGLYDCNIPDLGGYSPLQIASAEGRLEVVKQLIKAKADVDSTDKVHGNTALHEASWKGYSKTVAHLARANANLNLKNWGGFTALHLCCQKGHNQSCRELLLAGRNVTHRELCDPNIQNNYGDTPLHTSSRYGHAGVLRILISAECRISDQNKNGDTALHIAAAMNHRKLTRILLEAGCNKSILNKQNETAEDIAVRKSLQEIVEIIRNTKVCDTQKPTEELENVKKIKKSSKTKRKNYENGLKVLSPSDNAKTTVPWSPYGCHYYPDATDFPDPKLDTLPSEPLKKGEQYYLDLAGHIRKGPVGVGYTCYCAPFFRKLECHLDKKTSQLKKRINKAEENINLRLKNVEDTLNIRSSFHALKSKKLLHGGSLHRAKSLELIFDENGNKMKSREKSGKFNSAGSNDSGKKYNMEIFQDLLYRLENYNIDSASTENFESSRRNLADDNFRFSHRKYCRDLNTNDPKNLYSLYNIDDRVLSFAANQNNEFSDKPKLDVWRKSTLPTTTTTMTGIESCDSTSVECSEPNADIQCNDSGYSTKMCSNSQGPSPSLSGRLETDGLLSIEKHVPDSNVYKTTYPNIPILEASVV